MLIREYDWADPTDYFSVVDKSFTLQFPSVIILPLMLFWLSSLEHYHELLYCTQYVELVDILSCCTKTIIPRYSTPTLHTTLLVDFTFTLFWPKSNCKFCQFCSWNEKYPQIPSKCPQSVCSGSGSQPNMGHCWLRLMTTVSSDKGEKGERGDGTPVESDNQGRRYSFVGENGCGGELRRRASIVKSESS